VKDYFVNKSVSGRLCLYRAVFVLNMFGSTEIESSPILSGVMFVAWEILGLALFVGLQSTAVVLVKHIRKFKAQVNTH
jgi:hypothetical protein